MPTWLTSLLFKWHISCPSFCITDIKLNQISTCTRHFYLWSQGQTKNQWNHSPSKILTSRSLNVSENDSRWSANKASDVSLFKTNQSSLSSLFISSPPRQQIEQKTKSFIFKFYWTQDDTYSYRAWISFPCTFISHWIVLGHAFWINTVALTIPLKVDESNCELRGNI